MLALVGIAAVPLLASAATNIRLQRTVTDEHALMGHYGFMAALSYSMIGIGVLASIRPVGWRLSAWTAGLLSVLLGGTSMLYPDAASSLAIPWAMAAAAWGIAVIVLALRTNDVETRSVVESRRVAPEQLSSAPD